MAGKIIADIIEAPYNKITLNVGNTVVATMNASGLYTSTGNLIITQANQIGTSAITDAAVTQAKLGAGVAGNGPAFSAYPNATLSLSGGADTKVLFQTEDFDTNNNFASSRFTPTVAGYYQLSAMVRPNATNGEAGITIYKNGASFRGGSNVLVNSGNQYGTTVSALVYANGTTDYFEIYVYVTNSCTASASFQSTWFTGCMVRSA